MGTALNQAPRISAVFLLPPQHNEVRSEQAMFREHGDLSSHWRRVRMRKGRSNPPPWHTCSGEQL